MPEMKLENVKDQISDIELEDKFLIQHIAEQWIKHKALPLLEVP